MMNTNPKNKFDELREKAESILANSSQTILEQPAADIRNLIHDLSVYQIELELQNEELRLSQQQAEKARDSYYRLYNQAPAGYLTMSQQGIILQANQTLADMLEAAPAFLIGKQLANFLDESDGRIFLGRFHAFYNNPHGKTIDVRFRKQSGSHFWGQITGRVQPHDPLVTGKDGQQSQLLVIIKDITEQKRTEEALRASEERLNLVLKGTSDGVWDWNLVSGQFYYSDKWLTMLGYAPDEYPQDIDLWPRLMHPDDKERAQKMYQKAIEASAERYEVELRLRHKDGHYVPILTRGYILRDEQGKPVRMSGTNLDLTELKRIEKELRASEVRLIQAQTVAQIGSWERNLADNMVWASPEAFKIYGLEYTSPYLPHEVVTQMRFPEDQAHVEKVWETLFEQKGSIDFEFRIVRPNEKAPRILYSAASLVCDENGKPVKVIGVIQDITERKEIEGKLQRLNLELEESVKTRTGQLEAAVRDLSSLSYSIAHDLRTPLRAVNGFSHALHEEYESQLDDTGKDYLHRVIAASLHMEKLLEGLLTFLQVSRMEINVKKVDLGSLVSQSFLELRRLQPERQVVFICHPHQTALADPRLILIAIDQLMSNAWKFTKGRNPERIEFGGFEQDGKQVFFMRDSGIGFDMAYNHKLFGVFQRLHPIGDYEGIGIGLAIVKRIIDRHGGKIWAESALQQGTTFYFTLA